MKIRKVSAERNEDRKRGRREGKRQKKKRNENEKIKMGRRKQRRVGRRIKRIRHRREIEMKGKEWRHEEGKWDREGEEGRLSGTPASSNWGGERRAGSDPCHCWTTMNRGCAATSEACSAHQTRFKHP